MPQTAQRARREFVVMAKPGGPDCNLACRYCYYLDKERLFPSPGPRRMPVELLERYIVEHYRASPVPRVHFEWHGGEPTLLGLDYFRTIVDLERRHRPPGWRVTNGIQTNGLLLDEAWCQFLREEGFYVGLSLDGPEELHDACRIARGGQPTYRRVVEALQRLLRYRIPCDVLCVVHAKNAALPRTVYRHLRALGARSIQFLPLVEWLPDGRTSPLSVSAEAYGRFLCTVFEEWVRRDVGRVAVQIFDEALRAVCGIPHALCIFRETCGDVVVVEHNGEVFACDHFVDPKYRIGSLLEAPLGELLESEALRRFGNAKRETLPETCRRCEVLAFCNGGCPKDRFPAGAGSEAGRNVLCAGLRRFFTAARPELERLARKQLLGSLRSTVH
jgi:uncharacterized protein